MEVLVAAAAVVVCLFQIAAASGSWNYDDSTGHGPSHWSESYPTCGGIQQSPINIVTSNARLPVWTALTLTNYDSIPTNNFTLVNNGHSAQVVVNTKNIAIEGGGLVGKYILEQFHFHWGSDATTGSEHTINSKQYPLEVHFVHYSSVYPNVSTAAASGSLVALAVLGVFFEVNDRPSASIAEMEAITSNLKNTGYQDQSKSIPAFNLMHLLTQNHEQHTNFYRYSGSLTTPTCNQVVVWTVLEKPISVTTSQLNAFRSIHANALGQPDELLTHNYRPVQPLNGRIVKKGREIKSKRSRNN